MRISRLINILSSHEAVFTTGTNANGEYGVIVAECSPECMDELVGFAFEVKLGSWVVDELERDEYIDKLEDYIELVRLLKAVHTDFDTWADNGNFYVWLNHPAEGLAEVLRESDFYINSKGMVKRWVAQ